MNSVETYTAQIYVGLRAGYTDRVSDLEEVKDVCREYVNTVGLCVTVTKTEFIYTDGGEPGAIVGLINYPRFPSETSDIERHAEEIAKKLKSVLEQNRISIVYPQKTVMI